MAVNCCLKRQDFHFVACNQIPSAAPHNQKIPLTLQQALWYMLFFKSVDFTSFYFFSFSSPFSAFIILEQKGCSRLPEALLSFIMLLYREERFADSDIPKAPFFHCLTTKT